MPKKRGHILIVDDNPKNIQVLAAILSENNYDFEYAKNGVQALNWLDEEKFDLVLLDVMMPEMDGFETCQRLRAKENLRDLPVLFLTARTDSESLLKGFAIGGQDYISKPFHTDELIARCQTHIELKNRRAELQQLNQWLQDQILKQSKDLEEANQRILDASLKLDDMDEAKVEFLQIISHEIRTPLNHIVGFNAILQEMELDESSSKFLGYINQSIQRLEEFSYKALDITQIRAMGIKVLKRTEIDLLQTITTLFQEFENQEIVKRFSITNDLNLPVKIEADESFVKKAIQSIISNSLEHCGDCGRLVFSVTQNDQETIISVKDNGPGFSEKALERLFKPIAPGVKHIDTANVGLGLYFVHLIMQAHGGSVKAGNNDDQGAWVELIFKGVS